MNLSETHSVRGGKSGAYRPQALARTKGPELYGCPLLKRLGLGTEKFVSKFENNLDTGGMLRSKNRGTRRRERKSGRGLLCIPMLGFKSPVVWETSGLSSEKKGASVRVRDQEGGKNGFVVRRRKSPWGLQAKKNLDNEDRSILIGFIWGSRNFWGSKKQADRKSSRMYLGVGSNISHTGRPGRGIGKGPCYWCVDNFVAKGSPWSAEAKTRSNGREEGTWLLAYALIEVNGSLDKKKKGLGTIESAAFLGKDVEMILV